MRLHSFIILRLFTFCPLLLADVRNELELKIWGPGLKPREIVMPARYFFVRWNTLNDKPQVTIIGTNSKLKPCAIWVDVLRPREEVDTHLYVVRYKIYQTCSDLNIQIRVNGSHVGNSPYITKGLIQPDECDCHQQEDANEWLLQWNCDVAIPRQIEQDLAPFSAINFTEFREMVIKRYDSPHSVSLCHYVIKRNEIFRRCYGKYVGFKMFIDKVLLSLCRKLALPDVEFFFNLGDWPLVTYEPPVPIFSWCGSHDTHDIVVPTYDLTESTLETMRGVVLDMLSVQGNANKSWTERIPKAFWRGRDSNKHRLRLMDLSRAHTDLFDVALTNFFFFRDKEEEYGPKSEHVSFFRFFDFKYQLNIDGTVASYRFPYLLAGGSLVFKQHSKYYEHFYGDLREGVHYVGVEEDLSDLMEKVERAKRKDDAAKDIARQGVEFARKFLLPQNIFCYYVRLLSEYSKRITSKIRIFDDMERVHQKEQRGVICECSIEKRKDEL